MVRMAATLPPSHKVKTTRVPGGNITVDEKFVMC